jgi:hypothetical protein
MALSASSVSQHSQQADSQRRPEGEQRYRKDGNTTNHACHERPIPALRARWICQVAFQQRHIPKVGFPCEVENVSENRNRAKSGVEGDVSCDAQHRHTRCAQPDGFYKDPRSKNGASSIADARN